MTLAGYWLVAAQLVACVLLAAGAGSVVVGWIDRRIEAGGGERLGRPERALVSILSLLSFAMAAMVLHIASGGAVFGTPVVVPVLALVVSVVGLRRMKSSFRPSRRHLPVVLLGIALAALYVVPILVAGGSGVREGDPPWHLGWTEQLLAGEPVPTGPAPEFGRNAYPWGYHSVLATIVRLVPGSDPLIASETMHVLLLLSIPLAAACLARLVNRRAGLAAGALAGLVGGFGWLSSPSSALIASPSEARFGADLVVASPNSVYELFPPALPRELALVAVGAAAVLLAVSVRTRDRLLQATAGAGIGLVGLISVPMLVTAISWTIAVCLLAVSADRLRTFATTLGAALGVFLLWAGPVVAGYVRYGGFVDITPQLGVEWPLSTALGSWGLLLPLAIAGVILVALSQPPVVARPLLAFAASSFALLAISILRARLDWGIFGNETVLHQGRIWPPLHLVGAAFAAIALMAGYGWLRARSRGAAAGLTAVVMVVGAASPVVAARGMASILDRNIKGFVYDGSDVAPGSFARNAALLLGPDDIVGVDGSDELAFLLFQLSGVKLAAYDDPRLVGNELRIRFADLADRWNARIASGGFTADYTVRRSGSPIEGEVARGEFQGETWVMVDG